MKDGICPTCEGQENKQTYFCKLTVIGDDNFQKYFTLFQGDLERLFGVHPETFTENEIVEKMLEKMPMQFTAKISGNNLYNITRCT